MTQNKQLASLFGAVTQEEASFKVRAMATHYPQFVRIYTPKSILQVASIYGSHISQTADERESKSRRG